MLMNSMRRSKHVIQVIGHGQCRGTDPFSWAYFELDLNYENEFRPFHHENASVPSQSTVTLFGIGCDSQELVNFGRFNHLLLTTGPGDRHSLNCLNLSQAKGDGKFALREIAACRHDLTDLLTVCPLDFDLGTDRRSVLFRAGNIDTQPVVS